MLDWELPSSLLLALLECSSSSYEANRTLHHGFHVTAAHGALYHYYDPCDTPANEDRDSSEWQIVKLLSEAGLVRFAEPCVVECHEGNDACGGCLRARADEAGAGKGHGAVGKLAPLDWTQFKASGLRHGYKLQQSPTFCKILKPAVSSSCLIRLARCH